MVTQSELMERGHDLKHADKKYYAARLQYYIGMLFDVLGDWRMYWVENGPRPGSPFHKTAQL